MKIVIGQIERARSGTGSADDASGQFHVGTDRGSRDHRMHNLDQGYSTIERHYDGALVLDGHRLGTGARRHGGELHTGELQTSIHRVSVHGRAIQVNFPVGRHVKIGGPAAGGANSGWRPLHVTL